MSDNLYRIHFTLMPEQHAELEKIAKDISAEVAQKVGKALSISQVARVLLLESLAKRKEGQKDEK